MRLRPVREAAEGAVTSAQKSLGGSLSFHSETCEFATYLFLGAFLLLMA